MRKKGSIGVFDSGYGGLTILKVLKETLPEYDYIYLGDNARAPYGNRSFEEVYQFTKEAVTFLFNQGCPLVILACNTASAKALRSIQQNDLKDLAPENRILGVIRPSAEAMGEWTETKHIGLLATKGTVDSNSYALELQKFAPDIQLTQFACPRWVPLIENDRIHSEEGLNVIKEDVTALLEMDAHIDTLVLACTHYPIIQNEVQKIAGPAVKVIAQGEIVAQKLVDYLLRHPEINGRLTTKGKLTILTSGDADVFASQAEKLVKMKFQVTSVSI